MLNVMKLPRQLAVVGVVACMMLLMGGVAIAGCGTCGGHGEGEKVSCERKQNCDGDRKVCKKSDCDQDKVKGKEACEKDGACEGKGKAKKVAGECEGTACPLKDSMKDSKDKGCDKKGEKKTCPKVEPMVSDFEGVGVVKKLSRLFEVTKPEKKVNGKLEPLTDRVLVTKNGVYHFMETPMNRERLSGIENGTVIRVDGSLYSKGNMLSLKDVKALEEKEASKHEIDISAFKGAHGNKIVVEGINACQCQLDVAEMKKSCRLGHLHHLQDEKGRIFSYIPTAKSVDLIRGKHGTHGEKVKVEALRLPGNSLMVLEVKE